MKNSYIFQEKILYIFWWLWHPDYVFIVAKVLDVHFVDWNVFGFIPLFAFAFLTPANNLDPFFTRSNIPVIRPIQSVAAFLRRCFLRPRTAFGREPVCSEWENDKFLPLEIMNRWDSLMPWRIRSYSRAVVFPVIVNFAFAKDLSGWKRSVSIEGTTNIAFPGLVIKDLSVWLAFPSPDFR